MGITPENTVFVVLCFEGPDSYSMAGGLGEKITHMTNTLANLGFVVHHFFIGDPRLDGIELRKDGRLILHRWCQWISDSHTGGVYDGEQWKIDDYTKSASLYAVQEVIHPAISSGKMVVVLGEEWQTFEAMCCIHDLLQIYHLRDKAILFWNANEIYGFEQIDWDSLSRATTITVASEYMKQIMLKKGINPVVLPNGIPEVLLETVDEAAVSQIKEILGAETIFAKVDRWHQDNGWGPAVNAVNNLNRVGDSAKLLAHIGVVSDRKKVAHEAKLLGMVIKNITLEIDSNNSYLNAMSENDLTPYFEALTKVSTSDIFNFDYPIPPSLLSLLYQASDVVLADSDHDPFGFVGMEAMAAGSILFTSRRTKGHAEHMQNAVVLERYTAEEIQFYVSYLRLHPEKREMIRACARQTAEQWTFKGVAKRLLRELEYQAAAQGVDLRA
jgi:glycosyltransferase involved in cell wall biosynthesis